MGCCGRSKRVRIPNSQQNIVNAVQRNAARSNRIPAGTALKECENCRTKTITAVCPVCGLKIK
jgi:hypothetical protein